MRSIFKPRRNDFDVIEAGAMALSLDRLKRSSSNLVDDEIDAAQAGAGPVVRVLEYAKGGDLQKARARFPIRKSRRIFPSRTSGGAATPSSG